MQNLYSNCSLKREASQLPNEFGSFKIIRTDPVSEDDKSSVVNDGSKRKKFSEYKITQNETRQSNRHKTPSRVWKYFALATKHNKNDDGNLPTTKDDDDDRVLCLLCYAKGQVHVYKSKTSSSNLWKHLNRKHDIEIPTEKMFAVCTSNFDRFEFERGEEVDDGTNSTDYQTLPVLDDENSDALIKSENFQEIAEYTEEEEEDSESNVQSCLPVDEEDDQQQTNQTILKFDGASSTVKDIGLLVVEEVAKRPLLYDAAQSSKISSVRSTKELLWAEVYEALGQIIPIQQIQKIWRNIRDRYKKIRKIERDGQECLVKYKYYDHLSFLDESEQLGNHLSDREFEESSPERKVRSEDFSFLIEQNDISMLPSVDDLVQADENFTTEDVVNETSNNCIVSSSNPPTITISNELEDGKQSAPPPQQEIIIPPQPPQTPLPSANKSSSVPTIDHMDEFDLFGKLIANKLRNAPRDRVNLIEFKIMQAILENS